MGMLIFFAALCLVEGVALVLLILVYLSLDRAATFVVTARMTLTTYQMLASRRLKGPMTAMQILSQGFRVVDMLFPRWLKAFWMGFRWVGRLRRHHG